MYKLFLCLRYLRKRRIAFFAVAAVCLCVAMVLIVVSVMGGFLQMVKDRSRGMLGDLVMENGALQGFPYYQEFIDDIKADPVLGERIVEATPVIITYGVLRFPNDMVTKAVQVVGIRLVEIGQVNDFKDGLFYEKYYPGTTSFQPAAEPRYGLGPQGGPALPKELERAYQKWYDAASPEERAKAPVEGEYKRPGYYRILPPEEQFPSAEPRYIGDAKEGVILGTDLIGERQPDGMYERFYWRGEDVQITLVPMGETGHLRNTSAPERLLGRYIDDNRTGIYDIDSMSVYLDFDRLQELLIMHEAEHEDGGIVPARTTQVQINLRDDPDPRFVLDTKKKIIEAWERFYPPLLTTIQVPRLLERVDIKTWEEKQARFIGAVEKEKILVTTLFGVISVVAVFLVGVIFYMIVQQNTRDIGIIRSVGATGLGVAGIFIGYGAAVGIVGGALGVGLGTLFVTYINEIQDVLAKIHPTLVVWDPSVYTFDKIPNKVVASDIVVIYVTAIFASMLGAVMAAARAARIWPVEALRYE